MLAVLCVEALLLAFALESAADEPAPAVNPEPVPPPASTVPPSTSTGPPPASTVAPPPRRVWGLGSLLFGGGTTGTNSVDPSGEYDCAGDCIVTGPRFQYPTLEFQRFGHNGHSLDLSLPLFDTIVLGARDRRFTLGMDAFYNFNLGRKRVRLILGPGLGFAVGSRRFDLLDVTLVTLEYRVRLPAELGLEILGRQQNFGVKLLVRPWGDVGFLQIADVGRFLQAGAGVMAAVGVSGYALRR